MSQWPEPPASWAGSKPEWLIFWAFKKLGFKENVDFLYQSPKMGGRLHLGGVVLDFYFFHLNLGINVQSIYYHYASSADKENDKLQRARLATWNIVLIFIDEEDALRNPIYYAKEALAFRDHSELG